MSPDTPAPQPFFLETTAGRLFAVHYQAATAAAAERYGRAVLYLPPFAEEMNRSRRMAAVQARSLAGAGIGVLVLDLFGTGDSASDLDRARWEIWRDNVVAAVAWLSSNGYRDIAFLGLRLGACVGLDAAAECRPRPAQIVFWQPVTSGRTYLTQFLRLRIAAQLATDGAETTKALRDDLESGDTLEIAGYKLVPELAAALDRLRLAQLAKGWRGAIHWLQIGQDDAALPPASGSVIDELRSAGLAVTTAIVIGEQFWSVEETAISTAVLAATTDSLCGAAWRQ